MQKFAIGIPTLNRYDLLKPSLMLYTRDFPTTSIFVLDNGNQGIVQDGVTIVENEKNIGIEAIKALFNEVFGFKEAQYCAPF